MPIAFVDGAQFRIGAPLVDDDDDDDDDDDGGGGTDVPEPVTLMLFGTGLAAAGWRMRRRNA